jgi:predicted transcriptional regulator
MYLIYVRQKVDEGILAADEGRVVTQEEAERRMAKWLVE